MARETRELNTVNLLEMTNPRRVAEVAYRALTAADLLGVLSLGRIEHQRRLDWTIISQYKKLSGDWWIDFKTKHNISDGDLDSPYAYEWLREDYGKTISQLLLDRQERLSWEDVDLYLAIPDSFGDQGINISPAQHDAMLQIFFETAIAYGLSFASTDYFGRDSIERVIKYLAIRLLNCEDGPKMLEEYKEAMPAAATEELPPRVVLKKSFLDRGLAALMDPKETLSRIRIVSEAKTKLGQLGIRMPENPVFIYSETGQEGQFSGLQGSFIDEGGQRTIEWRRDKTHSPTVKRTKEVLSTEYSCAVALDSREKNSGVISVRMWSGYPAQRDFDLFIKDGKIVKIKNMPGESIETQLTLVKLILGFDCDWIKAVVEQRKKIDMIKTITAFANKPIEKESWEEPIGIETVPPLPPSVAPIVLI